MGRVKIPMAYRTDDRARRVTLCKRKKGLYKKAEELAKLCGVDVAVVIVGDGCKPAQMVSTGHGNYSDLPSCYRVLTRYTEQVTVTPLNTPQATLDARETLQRQDKELERQRREIEELRRQLAKTDPDSSLLVVPDTEDNDDEQSMDDTLHLECAQPPALSSKKRKVAPSSRQLTPNQSLASNATAEPPEMTIGEVDTAIAEMAAELKREGALAEGAMAEMVTVGKICENKGVELMNIEDIDAIEFDGKSFDARVLEAPWSGLPMVTSTEAVLGHCPPTAL